MTFPSLRQNEDILPITVCQHLFMHLSIHLFVLITDFNTTARHSKIKIIRTSMGIVLPGAEEDKKAKHLSSPNTDNNAKA